jgi:predicted transcriptional regulator
MKTPLGSSRELAQNKVILLYLIDRIDMPVSNLQITKIMLENRLMNYFFLQQFLNELCKAGYLQAKEEGKKEFYSITESGKQILDYFKTIIPQGIKKSIDNAKKSIRSKIRNETLVKAEIRTDFESGYMVKCSIHEDNFSLMDLYLAAGTRDDADAIRNNFKNNPQLIYEKIIALLRK